MPQTIAGSPSTSADTRRAHRLHDIVTTAASLFKERGYENTSVNDLAAELKMSIGGLYRYIATKSDVLTLVCEDIYGDLPDALTAIASQDRLPRSRMRALLETYFGSCHSSRALILLMYREYRHLQASAQKRFKAREEAIADVFERVIDEGIRRREFGRLDAWTLAHEIVLLGHFPALKGWTARAAGRSASDVVAAQVGLILRALEPKARR